MPLLDYTNANTGIFTHIGALIKQINLLLTDGNSYDAEFQTVRAAFEAGEMSDDVIGLTDLLASLKNRFVSTRQSLAEMATSRLLDYDTVAGLLALPQNNITAVLRRLIVQMIEDGQTVDASTVSFSAITAKSTNVGTGLVYLSTVLDGYSNPSYAVSAHPDYTGRNSEVAITETNRLICTGDAFGGSVSGEEYFEITGEVPDEQFGLGVEGSGASTTTNTHNAGSLLSNKNFETFTTANTPDNWTLDNGTAGTHIYSATSPVHRGSKCLKFTGNGALAQIKVSQAPVSTLTPLRRYFCAVAVRATNASGNLTISMQGTGYSPTAPTPEVQTVQVSGTPTGGSYTLTEGVWGQTTGAIAYDATSATVQAALRLLKGYECVVVATSAGAAPDITHQITFHGLQGNIPQLTSTSSLTGGTPAIAHATTTPGVAGGYAYIPAAALPVGAWHIAYFWFNTPASVPSDFALGITWSGTPGNTYSLYLDSVAFNPATYHNGYAVAVVSGQTDFLVNDEFTVNVTNDGAGLFQEFFREKYGIQLPSHTSGGETISDTLAS